MLENNEDLKLSLLKIVEDHFKGFAEENKKTDIEATYQELCRLLAPITNEELELTDHNGSSSTTQTATVELVKSEEVIVKLVGSSSTISTDTDGSDT